MCLYENYKKQYGKPDIIHGHSFFSGSFLPLISEMENIPYLITEHWSGFSSKEKVDDSIQLIKSAYSKCQTIISVSSVLTNKISDYFDKDILQIPNCVDFKAFKYESVKFPVFTFISIGYLHQRKRFDLLLDQFKLFQDFNKPSQLLIIGDGPLRDELQQKVKQLKLDKCVTFTGALTRSEVQKYLSMSHVLVSTSIFETFGMTLVEALACGIPVITTNTGGSESIMTDDRFGYMVSENATDFYHKMNDIYSKYQQIRPEQIREKAYEKFSEEKVIKKINEVYQRLLK
jgi:L-malate glycosyltransferase